MKCLKLTKKSLAPTETCCLNIEHMLNFLIWCLFLSCKSPSLTLKSDTSLSAPFSQVWFFFGTLPYNQIHLQKKYLFDASPGSAKITCENIAHTIYIRKYTLVPTLGFLKVYLSFEEKKKKKKLAGFKGVAITKATFRRFLIHKGTAAGRSVYTAALRHSW